MNSAAFATRSDGLIHLSVGADVAPLAVELGRASRAVPGKGNEDCHGVRAPETAGEAEKGLIVALADGFSAHGNGRTAAEITVRNLLADYYATPAGWSKVQSLEKLLWAANDWVVGYNRNRTDGYGIVAAVSVLVLSARQYFIAHIGNIRIYRLRGAAFEQLTSDHTWPRRDMRNVLRRAIGLDTHLVLDFVEGELSSGDTFVLVSDGVWDTIGERKIRALVQDASGAQAAADALVADAYALEAKYLGRNDASAIVLSVGSRK